MFVSVLADIISKGAASECALKLKVMSSLSQKGLRPLNSLTGNLLTQLCFGRVVRAQGRSSCSTKSLF